MKKNLGKVMPRKKQKNLAVFIDGPNILRKELSIDLNDIKKALKPYGKLRIAKVFLNQFASNKLVEAVANQGFEAIMTVDDIDVAMAVEATESIFNKHVHAIVFVSRDSDFLPAVIKAKRYGKETIVVLAEQSSAAALKNTADEIIVLKGT
ncbi:MAG: TIGR00288 family NYN domain-containing protein [Candidatus ainarchaeum sp.]|nr:TIGR00288 family NYN domain-containing protein [Candidatus ainarchaeum sp.]